jgi:hypothetical protein
MKLLLLVFSLIVCMLAQSGCSAGASVRHDGHRHGVGVTGSSAGPGVAAGVRAY